MHRPLARVGIVSDLDGEPEALAVQPVHHLVLTDQVGGQVDVAASKGLLGLGDLEARLLGHRHDLLEDCGMGGRLVAREGKHLADVHALVPHPLGVLDHVQQRRDEAKVGGDRRLPRQQ